MYVAIACHIMTCSISKGFATYHGSMECEINYNYNYNYNPHLKQQTGLSMYFNLYVLDNQCGQKILHYQCFYWMFSIMVIADLWVHLITLKTDIKLSLKVGQ